MNLRKPNIKMFVWFGCGLFFVINGCSSDDQAWRDVQYSIIEANWSQIDKQATVRGKIPQNMNPSSITQWNQLDSALAMANDDENNKRRISACESYLKQYPNGRHSAEANNMISLNEQMPARMAVSRATIRDQVNKLKAARLSELRSLTLRELERRYFFTGDRDEQPLISKVVSEKIPTYSDFSELCAIYKKYQEPADYSKGFISDSEAEEMSFKTILLSSVKAGMNKKLIPYLIPYMYDDLRFVGANGREPVPVIKNAAHRALVAISGADFGEDPKDWEKAWERFWSK